MPAHPIPVEPPPPADSQSDDAQYYRRILHKILDVGTDLIDLIQAEAKAQAASLATAPAAAVEATDGIRPDLSFAFDRVARAMRRTIMLADKITEDAKARANGTARHRAAGRKQIIREVEDVIQREAKGDRGDGLLAELAERLEQADLDDDIDTRPIDDIITDLCRDLGLTASYGTHPWKRRTPEDVAELCVRAAAPAVPIALQTRPGIAAGDVRAVGPPA